MELIPLQRPRVTHSFYVSVVKSTLDRTFSFCCLLLCLPLFVLISLAIMIDSPGGVLFRQTRIGQNGQQFQILKFRTMFREVPPEGTSPHCGTDPRITRVGRFLRRTSLDELPQLFNILRGEMSFVGPRPEQKSIVDRYYSYHERQRFLVKPGLTGLWQISKDRNRPIHENLHHDLSYIHNISFLLDAKIVCRTVLILFRSNTC